MLKTWINNFIDTTDWGLVAVIFLGVIIAIWAGIEIYVRLKDKD